MANFNIDYLVIAGGGGGGPGYQAGGGGAGGLLTNVGGAGLSLNTSVSYNVTVGAGGAGGASLTGSGPNKGSNGSNSQFASLPDAIGGGGGASYWNGNNAFGLDGGSGGGAAYTNFNTTIAKSGGAATAGQGNAGGSVASGTYSSPYKAGGGGGAGSAGINGTPDNGNGGDGLLNNITGTDLFYAGGGGGGSYYATAGSGGSSIGGNGSRGDTGAAPTSGTANTGSGGGGAGNTGVAGGDGGSGVVILRYTTSDVASYTTTGITPTETTYGTDTILSFTTVGTGTITFTAPAIPAIPGTRVTTPVTDFDKTNTIQGLKLPSGTNSNQPTGVDAIQGMLRNDTEETVDSSASALTHYNGTEWRYFAATESPDVVYPTSLKMYLDANDVASNPGSGTVWTDLTGNGNNGALVSSTFQSGTPKYVNIPGTDGSATRVNLAGTGGTTQVTNLVGSTQPLTVQGYCYFSSSGSGYDYFFIFGNGSSGSLVSIAKFDPAHASTPNRLYMYDGSSVLLSNYTASLNTWYNLAISVTGNTYKLYVNGVLEYTATGSTKNITTNTAQIGSYSASAGVYSNNLTGRVGEFRIYQAILTDAEILANFNNTKATYGL